MTGLAIALAVAAGLAGAVQAAVMGELGGRAGIFPALAFSGVVSVVLGLALLVVAKQSLRGLADVARQPVWLWTGGAMSVLIILAIRSNTSPITTDTTPEKASAGKIPARPPSSPITAAWTAPARPAATASPTANPVTRPALLPAS